MRLGIGWYTPATYSALREVADDGSTLPDTFEAWQNQSQKLLFTLRGEGIDPEQVFVNIAELVAWCKQHGLPCTGESRAKFVSEKVSLSPPTGRIQL